MNPGGRSPSGFWQDLSEHTVDSDNSNSFWYSDIKNGRRVYIYFGMEFKQCKFMAGLGFWQNVLCQNSLSHPGGTVFTLTGASHNSVATGQGKVCEILDYKFRRKLKDFALGQEMLKFHQ